MFSALCKEAEKNRSIMGLFLGGSRGKKMITPYSDYDVYIIVRDGMVESIQDSLKATSSPFHDFCSDNDIIVLTVDGLKGYPPWGTGDDFTCYDFLLLEAIIDKEGIIQPILDKKAERHVTRDVINAKIDAYINFFYRSLKCIRDGHEIGARLESNTSIAILLDLLFAMHDRPTPYGKYLEWELERLPLENLPIEGPDLLQHIKAVLDSSSIEDQRFLFGMVERVIREAGFGAQIDGWGDEPLHFMRDFKFDK